MLKYHRKHGCDDKNFLSIGFGICVRLLVAFTNGNSFSIYQLSPELAGMLQGIYTDLPPTDNDLVVDLN